MRVKVELGGSQEVGESQVAQTVWTPSSTLGVTKAIEGFE